jgi:RHS repeat-associated protein
VLELVVLAKQELQRLAHDVGSVRVDELGVSVQVVSDFFLQADTSHNNPAAPTSLTQGTAGQIGNAATYNGSTSHAAVGSLSLFNPTLITLSAWVNAISYPNSVNEIVVKDQSSDPYEGYDLRVDGGHLNFYISTGGAGSYRAASTTQPSTGSWHHVVGTFDGSNIKLFLDGSLVNSVADSGNMNSASGSLWFGNESTYGGRSWNGSIDEVRISSVARSADWISTEYKNQSSPSTFYSVGSAAQGTMSLSITQVTPSSANFGDSVVIDGTNFGTTQGSSSVSLNGTSVVVQTWTATGIDVVVPIGASSGYFTVTVNGQTAVSPIFTVRSLTSGWSDGDIGSVGLTGSASYANGTFTLQGAGQGMASGWATESFHFAYQSLSGDGTVVARVVSVQGGTYPEAGVIIRETLDPASKYAFTFYEPSSIIFFDRASVGGNTLNQGSSSATLPYWVKLVRSGSTFSSYSSYNGITWTQIAASQTITMAQNVYIGLAVSSQSTTILDTATFDNVSITSASSSTPVITSVSATTVSIGEQVVINGTGFGASQGGSLVTLNNVPVTINSWSSTSIIITIPSGATSGYLVVSVAPGMNDSNPVDFTVTNQPLPTPWLDQDVGQVGVAGSATYASGTFTVKGAGTDIYGTADMMHFAYQSLSGDGAIVARVVSAQGGTYPQVGVMIRETRDPASTFAYTFYEPAAIIFFDRSSTGGNTVNQGSSSATLPYWVKLVRVGNAFSSYASPDGVTWTQIGASQTITMAQNVYIGLAVCSQSNSILDTATFDNVSVADGTSPFVTGVSPDLGPTGTVATITGSNFGATQGTSTVNFNGVQSTSVASWSSTQVVATVPSTAPSGPGPVAVTVNSVTSLTNATFTVIKPAISSLTPPAAQVGGTVTLNGSGFGPSQASSTIKFNGTVANVSSWSDSSITVSVPGSATSGPVTVVEDGVTSNGVSFTVLEALTVTALSTSSGAPGSTVTITGTGFGSTQSNSSVVFFPAVTAAVTSWSDTQIVVTIPAAASGPVGMDVGANWVFGPSFTMTSVASLTDSLSNQTTYTSGLIGGQWVPISVQGSGCSSCTLRGTISYTYDNQGNALSRTDENGHATTYTYDSNGNVLTMTVPINSTTTATSSYTYNSFNEVLTTTDPLGKVTTNTYDANGNLLTVTTPAPNGSTAASVTTFTYDSKGELLTIKDPLNNVTTLTYYATGLINTIKDAQNNVTTYVYDTHGNRTSVTDANNQTTTFAYDTGDRLKTITYPGSTGTTTFGYDYRGRRTSVTDQNGKTTTYTYDDADRLLTVTDAASPGNVTTYGYDTENNLTSIKDPNNNTTSFTYDAFGRVTKTTFPSTLAEYYYYDAVGNLTSKTDRKNQAITYTYDQLNRLTQKSYPDSTAVNYTYDHDSRLTQVTDPTGTYQFTFDNMGRLTNTTTSYAFLTGRNFTTSYAYDAASNRTGFTDPESGSTSYVYDTLNRLQTLTPPAAFTATGNFGFSYDALSRRTQMTRPNGLKSVYAYDNLSRLQSVLHQSGSTTLDGAAYAVDNAGNRTSRTPQPSGTASNYAYDNIYQLTGVTQSATTTESYTYDPVGNRLSSLGVSSYTNNSSNELTSTSNASYTYDNNGNTLTKVVGTNTTSYTWDYENRMTSVTLPGTGGTDTFKYDPFGRRIYKSFSAGTTSVYAYDGDNLIEETNSSGVAVARYSQTQNIDEPLAMLRSAATSYFHADGLGSVTSLSNAAGSIANTYTYDSFGKLTASTGSLVNPFQYTARESDTETGLYYYRARYYDQTTGRLVSEDPIKFKGGINFYRYAKNNPVNLVDPFGLNPGVVALPWWWPIFVNPITIPIVTVGAGGAAIIIGIGEATLAPSTAIDDSRAIPKPTPCEAKRKACTDQWAKDIEFCAAAYPDDPYMQEACYQIADLNMERCLNGQPRVNPRPTPRKKP